MYLNILKHLTFRQPTVFIQAYGRGYRFLFINSWKNCKAKRWSKTHGKKRPNKKEEFNKLDEFNLGIIRRIIHTFYQNNDTFSLRKLLNKLREEIKFPNSTTTLSISLKKLGFRYKKRQRESIIHERSDLVSWRGTF